jgi:hypothetical protein
MEIFIVDWLVQKLASFRKAFSQLFESRRSQVRDRRVPEHAHHIFTCSLWLLGVRMIIITKLEAFGGNVLQDEGPAHSCNLLRLDVFVEGLALRVILLVHYLFVGNSLHDFLDQVQTG